MGIFNFTNSTEKQILNDAKTINITLREIIQKVDSNPMTLNLKLSVSEKLSDIETESYRIVSTINQLSDSNIMSTKVPWINGEKVSANQWLFMFSMMMDDITKILES